MNEKILKAIEEINKQNEERCEAIYAPQNLVEAQKKLDQAAAYAVIGLDGLFKDGLIIAEDKGNAFVELQERIYHALMLYSPDEAEKIAQKIREALKK
ncbi:Hypothetical protein LUCI_0454 [Lucifera butyrica]|uniref:Uncharacterized protein n=1 Tax=Lucifera butyrica TaxID=1351585 RepID=A0A498R343_9FIRM|nr:hypothetical protein [Lucifera butyrica]VBB05247.1 Hypothetical protein LUCI_0454 [Lucifera butyrica]